MVFINEFFPNPVGPDATSEFIELYNSGNAAVNLDGWKITTNENAKTKPFLLTGHSVPPQGYLFLKKQQTKITLKNTDGELLLYDASGAIIDKAAFVGPAPQGKSFSRVNYDHGPESHFIFEDPTPGYQNHGIAVTVIANQYPFGVNIAPRTTPTSLLALIIGTAATIIVSSLYIIIKNGNVSHIIFGRDQANWH